MGARVDGIPRNPWTDNMGVRGLISDKAMVVVIATSGRGALLERTLGSIESADRPHAAMEIVVVENGGQGGAREVVERFEATLPLRYIFLPVPNKSAALNRALEEYGNCLFVFFDDDVRIGKGTLCAYERAAAGQRSGTFYGGPLAIDYESPPPDWLLPFLPRSAAGWSLGNEGKSFNDRTFLGANWAALSQDIKGAGGFPATLGPGAVWDLGEDGLMQQILLREGCNGYYVPEAIVWHFVPKGRCSPQWALDRAFRQGSFYAFSSKAAEGGWFGCPRWAWRELLEVGLKRVIKSFAFDRSVRFSGRFDWAMTVGKLSGFRRHSRHSAG